MALILQDGQVPKPDYDLIVSVFNEAMNRADATEGNLYINHQTVDEKPYYFTNYVGFKGPRSMISHGFGGPVDQVGGYNGKSLTEPNERNATVNIISQKILQHP